DSEEVASGVAHDHPGGMEVEDQEADAATHQRPAHHDDVALHRGVRTDAVDRRQQQHHGDDADHPCGRAVDAVDEVDGDLQPGDPGDGDRQCQPGQVHHVRAFVPGEGDVG